MTPEPTSGRPSPMQVGRLRSKAARGDLAARNQLAALDAEKTTPDPDAGPAVGSVGHHKAIRLAQLAEEHDARQDGRPASVGTVAGYREQYLHAARNAPQG